MDSQILIFYEWQFGKFSKVPTLHFNKVSKILHKHKVYITKPLLTSESLLISDRRSYNCIKLLIN